MKHWIHSLLPTACLCCSRPVSGQLDLCSRCHNSLPIQHHSCWRCGRQTGVDSRYCGLCMNTQDWRFRRCVALLDYRSTAVDLITRFKYGHGLAAGRTLALMLAAQLEQCYRDQPMPRAIVTIPLHWRKLIRRGYNQSHEIARILSAELTIPIEQRICRRLHNTESQTTLTNTQRKRNVKSAFICTRTPRQQYLVLIDDVVTSGATANSVAATLLAQRGDLQLDLWCLARA